MRNSVLDTANPIHVPILLPGDIGALEHVPASAALMLSAVYSVNPRLAPLLAGARERAELLLVDPKTAHFQFEGYMSMPDYRSLPYSPGRGALGTLWEPARFAREAARAELIENVFAVQERLGAGAFLAPYFYVPHPEHRWLETCRSIAEDAISSAPSQGVGVPVCVDIDALIDRDHRDAIVAAYRGLDASFLWVTVVNYDERRADPRDARAMVSFLGGLQADGVPVVLAHAGRTGLLAIACGAAGYASGTHGFEAHPRALFREMMGSRPANSYYLHRCYFHLPVRLAQACLNLEEPAAHPTCGCAACGHERSITRMVSRRLSLHSMLRRFVEVDEIRSVEPADRRGHLVDRFSEALRRSSALAEAVSAAGAGPIREGEFHYLEVLREAAGGPAATLPLEEADDAI